MPPTCECHDVPMIWHKRKTHKDGGRWECVVRKREVDLEYWRRNYYGNSLYWVKQQIRTARLKREERIRQHGLSHSQG